MEKIIRNAFILLVCASFGFVNAQTTDNNYVKTFKAQQAITGDISAINNQQQVIEVINYYDGLGRVVQTVTRQGSPGQKDIVQPVVYDTYGRNTRNYLPFVSAESSGALKVNVIDPTTGAYINDAATTYNNSSDKIADDSKPYAETIVELSGLARPLKQGATGITWQPTSNVSDYSDKSVKKQYSVNAASTVLMFSYNATSGEISCKDANGYFYYDAAALSVVITFDEENREVLEYVDKEGKTILKNVESGVLNSQKTYASTYYIYDDYNNLVVVLSPEAVKEILAQL